MQVLYLFREGGIHHGDVGEALRARGLGGTVRYVALFTKVRRRNMQKNRMAEREMFFTFPFPADVLVNCSTMTVIVKGGGERNNHIITRGCTALSPYT